MFWIFIFILMLIIAGLGIAYLTSRICRFEFVQKISRGNRKVRIIIGLTLLLAVLAVIWLTMGPVNAVVCMIHLALFWFISDIIFFSIEKRISKKRKRYYAGGLAITLCVVYLSMGWFLANHVWETNYTIMTDKEVGELRIVQFADSHIGTTFDGKEFEKYVDQMEEQNPDVVMVTGDFVDDDTSKEDMIDACKALGTMKTTYGVYYSFGNHDKGYYNNEVRGFDGDDLIDELEKNHVTVLQDESVLIDNRFYIIGRQDLSEELKCGSGRATMEELISELDRDKFMIVMDHQPCDYDSQVEANIDLMFSGHTHGGQMIPLGVINTLVSTNDKVYGHEKIKNTNFIVTSGISDWAMQFKTGCKSEYVVVDVKGN